MKTRLLFAFLILTATFTQAQELPKEGGKIKLDQYDVSVAAGESVSFEATLLRAKRFQKASIDGLVVQDKAGIFVTVGALEAPDKYLITIKPEVNVSGSFPLIIKATGKMAHKVKSTMVMLTVSGGESLVSGNE